MELHLGDKSTYTMWKKNCEICHLVKEGSKFENAANKKSFKTNFGFTWNTENVFYLLICNACRK